MKTTTRSKPGQNISFKIAEAVIAGFYAGRFSPGQRLVESDLMQQFEVGRSSVREALNNLEARRLVETIRHKGAFVRKLSRKEAHDTVAVFQVLNGLLARLAAKNIGESGLKEAIAAAFVRMTESEPFETFVEIVAKRNAYYDLLLQVADNKVLAEVYASHEVHLVRVQFQSLYTRYGQDQVEEMNAAIFAGEADAAEVLGRDRTMTLLNQIDLLPAHMFRQV